MKFLLSPLWAILTTLMLSYAVLMNTPLLQNLELKFSDQLILDEPVLADQVVLIDISEKSLEVHGQFPFERDVYGELIVRLRDANAGAIVFNMSFPEEDRTGQDELFKSAMQMGVVLAHFPTDKTQARAGYATGLAEVGQPAGPYVPRYAGIAANIEEYESRASGIGIANTLPEIDGVVRRLPMVSAVDDKLYPSIILEILKIYTGTNTFQIKSNDFGVEAVRVKGFPKINTDSVGRVWINPNYTFERYEMTEEFPDLQGKTVFIGLTAEGLSNPVGTPSGARYGHDITASSLMSVLSNYSISTPAEADLYKILAIFAIGLLTVVLSYIRFGWALPIIMIGGAIYFPFYMFATYAELHYTTIPALMAILVFAHVYAVKYGQEYFEKQKIKKQFAGYASPTVVRLLQENPSLIKDGMKKEVSIVFSDLRGFTPLGESFGDDVKGLTKIMNGYMDAITQPILDSDGMVIKYIGDASMHVHNAPINDPHHPKTAVQCGLDMLKAVEKFNDKITSEGRPPVGMGAGVNTGLGYLGEMGSTARHSYDVLGDSVSTAARIESKCKEYGCVLLIGDATYQQTKTDFFYLKIDDLAVKGKTVGITIWTVLDNKKPAWTIAQRKHDEMHEAYQAQKFNDAIDICKMMKGHFDGRMDEYYDMWIERCDYMLTQDLPKDWNGVFIATTK